MTRKGNPARRDCIWQTETVGQRGRATFLGPCNQLEVGPACRHIKSGNLSTHDLAVLSWILGFSVCNEEVRPDGLWEPTGLRTESHSFSILWDPLSRLSTLLVIWLSLDLTPEASRGECPDQPQGGSCVQRALRFWDDIMAKGFFLEVFASHLSKWKMILPGISSPLSLLLHFIWKTLAGAWR